VNNNLSNKFAVVHLSFPEFDNFMERYEAETQALLESGPELLKERQSDLERAEQRVFYFWQFFISSFIT